jgi:hypothetical protein
MAKGTRRKSGKRDKSGRLAKATTRAERHVPPNDRVAQRMERFGHKSILGGRAAHDTFDGPGQLHALGYFHDLDFEPSVIRDIFREYGELYFHWYAALQPKAAELERHDRGEPSLRASRSERRFMDLDSILPLVSEERRAVHKLVLDHWGCDSVHPFVERLVNEGMMERKLPVAGMLALVEDFDTLKAALRAATSMIEGRYCPLKIAA